MEQIIIDIMSNYGYLGIFILLVLENVFPPIPSEAILLFAGFMSTYTSLNIIIIIFVSTLGSILGAIMLYYLGAFLGKENLIKMAKSKIGKIIHIKVEVLEVAISWFNKKGYIAIFVCRFIPIVRSLISVPAGISKIKIIPFIFLTFLGSFCYNGILVYIGAVTSYSWDVIFMYISKFSKYILLFFIIVILIIIYIKYMKTRSFKKCNKHIE